MQLCAPRQGSLEASVAYLLYYGQYEEHQAALARHDLTPSIQQLPTRILYKTYLTLQPTSMHPLTFLLPLSLCSLASASALPLSSRVSLSNPYGKATCGIPGQSDQLNADDTVCATDCLARDVPSLVDSNNKFTGKLWVPLPPPCPLTFLSP